MQVALESCPTLVLNADFRPLSYFPLSIWPWQDAVKATLLGRVNTVAEYDRVILEWLAKGRKRPENLRDAPGRLMCELAAAYWEFAQEYYRKNGRPTAERCHIRAMLRHLQRPYGRTGAL